MSDRADPGLPAVRCCVFWQAARPLCRHPLGSRALLLILIRDQLGLEPLYYTDASTAGTGVRAEDLALVAVVNSLTVLARLMPSQSEVDERAMADLLLGTFLTADATAYRGIHTVVPGEAVEIDDRGQATRRPSWRLPNSRASGLLVSARDQARVEARMAKHLNSLSVNHDADPYAIADP